MIKNEIKFTAVTTFFANPPFDIYNNETIQGNTKLKRCFVTGFLLPACVR